MRLQLLKVRHGCRLLLRRIASHHYRRRDPRRFVQVSTLSFAFGAQEVSGFAPKPVGSPRVTSPATSEHADDPLELE